MKVIAFNGSPRHNGNTASLINTTLEELQYEGIETEVVNIGGKLLHGCTACYKCFETKDKRCAIANDMINECIQKMNEADGIILASPTYFADVTAEMKAFMDRCGMVSRANGDIYKRKAAAAIVAVRRCGAIHAFDTMNHFFMIGQMVVASSSYWNVGIGRESGAVLNDEEGMKTMKDLGKNMAWLLKKINA